MVAESMARHKYTDLLSQEEKFARQKSRQLWLEAEREWMLNGKRYTPGVAASILVVAFGVGIVKYYFISAKYIEGKLEMNLAAILGSFTENESLGSEEAK
ncbi:hypothetical protein QJS10_CPB17g00592 [Acorus calamus]|uniref:Uncharacterized protein n=1 Tax=Acorus calamus TaxID=4465 RepID=A0AAV9CTT0_ACOCL|nr:hypothetical protein QJS10_CPB17g00592 [Acorus calamus]